MTETLDPIALREINAIANALAFRETGERNTCISTSAALRDALVRLGCRARTLRVEAPYYPPCDCCGGLLGFRGNGTRRPPASPGMWGGHVAVVVDETYLLDPTLDQLVGAEPFVGAVTPESLAGETCIFWFEGVGYPTVPEGARADDPLRRLPEEGRLEEQASVPLLVAGAWSIRSCAWSRRMVSAATWTWRRRSDLVATACGFDGAGHGASGRLARHVGPSGGSVGRTARASSQRRRFGPGDRPAAPTGRSDNPDTYTPSCKRA